MVAFSGNDVYVRVTADPTLRVEVPHTSESQRKLLLPGLDIHARTQRRVFEASRNIDNDFTAWQPALAVAVDVCIRDLAQSDVSANVHVPAVEIAVDVRLMPR